PPARHDLIMAEAQQVAGSNRVSLFQIISQNRARREASSGVDRQLVAMHRLDGGQQWHFLSQATQAHLTYPPLFVSPSCRSPFSVLRIHHLDSLLAHDVHTLTLAMGYGVEVVGKV